LALGCGDPPRRAGSQGADVSAHSKIEDRSIPAHRTPACSTGIRLRGRSGHFEGVPPVNETDFSVALFATTTLTSQLPVHCGRIFFWLLVRHGSPLTESSTDVISLPSRSQTCLIEASPQAPVILLQQ